MDEINKYKEVWQNQKIDNQLDTDTLHSMIQKKSTSIVKWIFYISIIEFSFILILNLIIKTDWNEYRALGLYNFLRAMDVLGYGLTLFFIYLFYKNHKKISVVNSTKELTSNILKTRRTVKYYIYFNLLLVAVASLYSFYIILQSDEYLVLIEKFGKHGLLKIWIIVGLALGFILGVILLFYLLLYGYLMKKLQKNYLELTEEIKK